jgi:flagellar biogenesis protein FliO
MPHRFGPLGHKRRIQVLETVPIGDKRSLTLIRIDDEGLLLASTPTTVSLIKEVRLHDSDGATQQEPREVAASSASTQGQKETALKFSDTLAAEIRHAHTSLEGSLAGFTRFRQELEAR